MFGLNAYEGEPGRLALLSRARDAEALIQYVLAAAQQRGLQVTESWASRIESVIAYLNAWEQNTDDPKWPSAASSLEAEIAGLKNKALAFQAEIIVPQKDVPQSTVTSAGTLVIDTTKPSPMQVAVAQDAVIKAQAARAAQTRPAAKPAAKVPAVAGTSTMKIVLAVGAVVVAGLGAMYLYRRSKTKHDETPPSLD